MSKIKCLFMIKFVLAIALLLITFSSMAQDSIRSNIEKAYRDPGREKNSAKADLYIQGKKIMDTVSVEASGTAIPRSLKNENRRKVKRNKKQ
jgi:hypothetical protein